MPTPSSKRARTKPAPSRAKAPARSRQRKRTAPPAEPAAPRRYASKSRASNAQAKQRHAESLPTWQDLDGNGVQQAPGPDKGISFLEQLSTGRLLLVILALAVVFTAYVGHVHATQALLADVQEVRRENMHLHLKYNRLKGDFDRVTGPEVITRRAEALGLQPGAAFGPQITLED